MSNPDLQTVVKYLLGEGPLCGAWFNDGRPDGEKGNFWWRRHLRAALKATAAQHDEIAQDVFGDPNSEWHGAREKLEIAALRAAAELMSHTQASWVQFEGFGVKLTIELTGTPS